MDTSETKTSVFAALTPFRWDLLGFGFCRAWITGLIAYSANEVWSSGAPFGLQVILYVSAAVVAFAIVLFSKKIASQQQGKMHTTLAVVFTFVGLLGMLCVMLGKIDTSEAFVYLGFILVGAGGGFFETIWGVKFSKIPSRDVQVYTFFVMAVSSLLGVALGFLPTVGFYLTLAILLGLNTLLFVAKGPLSKTIDAAKPEARTATENNHENQRHIKKALTNILLCYLIFSLIYNLVITITYNSLPSETASQIRFWANTVAALVLLGTFLFIKPISSITLFRLILPITAVGFVLYLVSSTAFGEIALMISSIGRKFFDILTWVIIARAIQESGLLATKYFGLLTVGKNLGYAFGLVLAMAALGALDNEVIQIATIVPILLLALIVCFFWIFPERTLDSLFGTSSSVDKKDSHEATLERNVDALSLEYKLTPRETEVFILMAKGRNLEVIKSRLHISKSTTHTHISHVYQKLGVHGLQELIEMVEHYEPSSQIQD